MTMKRFGKSAFALMLAVMLVMAMSVTAFAQVDEDINANAPTEEATDGAFSVPGNGEVLDDVTDSEREFYTITTANGNTYFLVIDKSGSNENVYMLSMIDEYDLQDFIDGSRNPQQSTQPTTTTVVIPDTVQNTEPTTSEDTAPMQEQTIPTNLLLTVLLIAVGGVGAFFYFKVYKPKQEQDYAPSENMEVNDGLETINEDETEEEA